VSLSPDSGSGEAIKILILKMLKMIVLRAYLRSWIWARCWKYWEMSSDEDSDEKTSAQIEPFQASKGNKICFILFLLL